MRQAARHAARLRALMARSPRRAALIGLALAACLALALPVLAQVSAAYNLSWHTIAGGGGRMESAQHTLHGTVGQAVTGQASSGGHTLCSGFWCGVEAEYRVYLPLVLR
jgi:hypothetical protein